MSPHRFHRSIWFRTTSLVALLAAVHGPIAAAPEDTVREGSPGLSKAASALAAPSSRATGQVMERTGAYSYAYPIAVPPGRLGMEPSLSLTYSSDTPLAGGVAAGWRLSLPEIARDSSRGFDGTDRDWVSPNGRLVRYAEPGTTGANTFRAWGDASYARFTRVSDSMWEGRTTAGLVHRFERPSAPPSDDRFLLTASTDRFGNSVQYIWQRLTSSTGLAYDQLQAIEYTSNANLSLGAHARVSFSYAPPVLCGDGVTPVGARLTPTTSGALMLRDASVLSVIRTEVRDALGGPMRPVREVTLSYRDLGCGAGGAALAPLRILSSIQERARSPEGVWTSLPAVGFQYGDLATIPTTERAGENFTAGRWAPQPNALAWGLSPQSGAGLGSWDWNEVHSMLIDVDGDGDQDRLVASRYIDAKGGLLRLNQHCTALLYRNLGGNHFGDAAYPVVLPRQWGGKFCTLSSQPKIPPYGSATGVPTVSNGETVPVSMSRFLDIDHDGLIDVVSAVYLPVNNEGGNDQSVHHPNCDTGVQNPSWVVCGGPGDSVRPPVFPPRTQYDSIRRNQYYNGRYVWRWYRNTGHSDFELVPRFVASPIPLDMVGVVRFPNDFRNRDEFAVVDLTGDGVLDAVWHSPATSGWAIWKGNGQGSFTGNPDGSPLIWTAPSTADATRSVRHDGYAVGGAGIGRDYVTSSLFDVNGDGLVDLVTEDPNLNQARVLAHLNNGRGFAPTPIVVLGDSRKAVERLFGTYVTTSQGTVFHRNQERRLADLNGDGILDRVDFTSTGSIQNGDGTLSVVFGFGPTFNQPPSTTTSVSAYRGIAASAYHTSIGTNWYTFGETTDVDGDGYEELFGSHELFGLPPSSSVAPPGLLTRIESGRDASTVIHYASRTDSTVVGCSTPVTPFAPCHVAGQAPRRVVRDVTVWSQGRSGPAVTSYQYEDPVVASDELGRPAFRGFTRIRSTAPSHGYGFTGERRAVSIFDFSYGQDYRGQMVARRMLDEEGRLQGLDEHVYTRLHVAASGALPTFGPRFDRHWVCVARAGTLSDQENACRSDTGLETTHSWTAFAPHDISGFPWGLEGDPGPDLTLWLETTTTQTGVGSAAGGPVRRADSELELVLDNTHYLVLPKSTTQSESVNGTSIQLARQITEYEQMPLALPYKSKTWLHDDVYATSMRSVHAGSGVVLWEQKPEQYRRAPGATDAQRIKTSYAYDSFFLYPIATINEVGHSFGTTRDPGTSAVIATRGPNAWVDPACNTGCQPILEQTRAEIDGFGRVLATWRSDDDAVAGYQLKLETNTSYHDLPGTWQVVETRRYQALGDTTTAIRERVELDATGLVISSTQFAGATGGLPLDATTSFVHDPAGSPISVTVPDPSNDTQDVTYRSEYDALGRELKIDQPDGASVTTTYEGTTVTRHEVAAAGDPDPGPLATKVAVIDAFGDLRTITEVDDTLSAVTAYDYDGLGRVRQITDPEGLTTVLFHDGGGRRLSVARTGTTWRYGYDDNGNQTSIDAPHLPAEDPLRFLTSVVYDDLDRPVSRFQGARDLRTSEVENFGDGTTVWSYDQGANGLGRLRSVSRAAGTSGAITRTYGYDASGNPRDEDLAFNIWNGAFSDNRHIARTFDALGRPRTIAHADAVNGGEPTRVAYDYDQRGLPSTARWLNGPGATAVTVATLTWNRAGFQTRRENAVSEQTLGHYRNGRLHHVGVQARTSPSLPWSSVASQGLKYFAAGDVKFMETSTEIASEQATFYEDWTFDYNDRHQLSAVSGPSYEGLFAYTAAGRLSSVYVDGPPDLDRDVFYYYMPPSLGDPETVRFIRGQSHWMVYGWDAAGNQISKRRMFQSNSWAYRYDGADELREARGTVDTLPYREVYWYDADGQRTLALTFDGAGQPSSLRLWVGEDEIHYGADGTVAKTQAYLAHGGSIGRIIDGSTIEYTFQNHLGHLLAAVDGTGVATAGFTYSPFGELIRTLGPDAASFRRRFNGKEDDAATGLQYYGARYYDDFALLWTQADPLYTVLPDGARSQPRRANRYSFSGNNPLRYVDLNGLDESEALSAEGRLGWGCFGSPCSDVRQKSRDSVEHKRAYAREVTAADVVRVPGKLFEDSVCAIFGCNPAYAPTNETVFAEGKKSFREEAQNYALAFVGGVWLKSARRAKHVDDAVQIGGESWRVFKVGEEACRGQCDEVATAIQQRIGGRIGTIHADGLKLGGVRNIRGSVIRSPAGPDAAWYYHKVVVKEGRVFDALTGPVGQTIERYKKRWQYSDALKFDF